MRRLARWTLNAMTVLSLVMCVASGGIWARSYWRGDYVGLSGYSYLSFARGYCRVVVGRQRFRPTSRPWAESAPLDAVGEYPRGSGATYVPLWLPTGASAALAIYGWRERRRRSRASGRCPACSYDLTGNVSGVCPECGTTMTPLPSAQPASEVP